MSNYRNNETERLAEIFKALSSPHRLRIFMRLVSCCAPGTVFPIEEEEAASCCVSDLGAELRIAPSTLSHHIKELNRAGLLRLERRGKYIDCRVDPETVEALKRFFTVDCYSGTNQENRKGTDHGPQAS